MIIDDLNFNTNFFDSLALHASYAMKAVKQSLRPYAEIAQLLESSLIMRTASLIGALDQDTRKLAIDKTNDPLEDYLKDSSFGDYLDDVYFNVVDFARERLKTHPQFQDFETVNDVTLACRLAKVTEALSFKLIPPLDDGPEEGGCEEDSTDDEDLNDDDDDGTTIPAVDPSDRNKFDEDYSLIPHANDVIVIVNEFGKLRATVEETDPLFTEAIYVNQLINSITPSLLSIADAFPSCSSNLKQCIYEILSLYLTCLVLEGSIPSSETLSNKLQQDSCNADQ